MYRIVFKIIYITDTVYYVDTLMLKFQWICFFFSVLICLISHHSLARMHTRKSSILVI